MNRYLILGLLFGLIAACGEEDRAKVATPTGSGGLSGSSGSGSGSGGNGGEGVEPSVPGAPVIEITSPAEVEDPNDGEVLIDDEVEVVCSATQSTDLGAKPVDAASVKIALIDADGNVVNEVSAAPTDNEDEYSATLVVSSVPNGPVEFRCTANDDSSPPITGSGRIETFVDHGPAISVANPLPDSAHSVIGAVSFEFSVEPDPLAAGDDGAEVSSVTLEVAGIPIEVEELDTNLYGVDLDLDDPTLFPKGITGSVPVTITATNSREPTAVTRTLNYSFLADGTGPKISVTSHENADVIGGEVVLVFDVTDDNSGVDAQSVIVKVNTEENRFENSTNWTHNGNTFTFRFDSRTIEGSSVQATINIIANDNVGNPSGGQSLTLWLDNFAPTIDLDPGNVRERKKEGQNVYCSESFDPLGAAVGDLANVGKLALYRALVWDETNDAGQSVLHMSGADPSSVRLYIQNAGGEPMLIDTDGDGTCDDVDEELDLNFLSLTAVGATGSAWYSSENVDPPAPLACTAKGDANPPVKLCTNQTSDLTRVIKHVDPSVAENVIYASPELAGVECTGAEWEITPFVTEGWVCLAAVASDRVGNHGVSPPIRVCFDDPDTVSQPACVADKSSPPSCTAVDCTAPPGFGPAIIDI